MKKIIVILLAIAVLVGCSSNKHDDIGEYKFAKYDDYSQQTNSPVLDGDKIYIEGTVFDVFSSGPAVSLIVEQKDKKQWIVGISYGADVNKEDVFENWIDKEITACGTYIGWSDPKKCPSIMMGKIIYNEKEYTVSDFNMLIDSKGNKE